MGGIDSYFLAIIAGLLVGTFVFIPLIEHFKSFPESIEKDSFEHIHVSDYCKSILGGVVVGSWNENEGDCFIEPEIKSFKWDEKEYRFRELEGKQ